MTDYLTEIEKNVESLDVGHKMYSTHLKYGHKIQGLGTGLVPRWKRFLVQWANATESKQRSGHEHKTNFQCRTDQLCAMKFPLGVIVVSVFIAWVKGEDSATPSSGNCDLHWGLFGSLFRYLPHGLQMKTIRTSSLHFILTVHFINLFNLSFCWS